MQNQTNRAARQGAGRRPGKQVLPALAVAAALALAGFTSTTALAQGATGSMTQQMETQVADELVDGFEPEQFIKIERIEGDPSEHLWVTDTNFMSMVDGRLNVFRLEDGHFLGLIPIGFNGLVQLSRDGSKVYLVTTYFERIFRGERTDLLEVWDAATLTFEKEIKIPNKRASSLNYDGLLTTTYDGRFALVQNATPAQSVTVVDLKEGQFTEEITATAGCWTMHPLPQTERSFATVCGDGSLRSMTIGEDGKLASQSQTAPMFSVKDDPIFVEPAFLKDGLLFFSFYGNVYPIKNDGEKITLEPSWSLLDAEDRKDNWVPGTGNNVAVADTDRGRLYVLMHPNGAEGTHKSPAAEIWVFDLDKRARIARVPGKDALSLSIVRKGENPLMASIDGENVTIYDISGDEPKLTYTLEGAANTSIQMMVAGNGAH